MRRSDHKDADVSKKGDSKTAEASHPGSSGHAARAGLPTGQVFSTDHTEVVGDGSSWKYMHKVDGRVFYSEPFTEDEWVPPLLRPVVYHAGERKWKAMQWPSQSPRCGDGIDSLG